MGTDLSSSMEDYLEAIAILNEKDGVARVKDISRFLSVEPPSVASAVKNLSKSGLVIHERYGYVQLTSKGKKVAGNISKRHKMLFEFLTEILNIQPRIAQQDACQMEHSVSSQTLEKITKFIEFVRTPPQADKPEWLKSFDHYFKTGKRQKYKKEKLGTGERS